MIIVTLIVTVIIIPLDQETLLPFTEIYVILHKFLRNF